MIKAVGNLVHIHNGEHYVSATAGLVITTVLGSCIGACIRDPRLQVGGMNHFMLPGNDADNRRDNQTMRYGLFAMEQLINDLLAAGARRDRLEIKLFGGANTLHTGLMIGDNNVAFIRRYLAEENMPISAQDLGGRTGRRIRYTPTTGQVMRLRIAPKNGTSLFDGEAEYRRSLRPQDIEGSVELFG